MKAYKVGDFWSVPPEEIRKLRGELNLSLERFAAILGVSYLTVRGWERGTQKPHGGNIQKLLDLAMREGK